MSSLQIGRLLLGPPSSWTEATGNAMQSQGGVAVPATRSAPQFQVAIATWSADGNTDTPAARLINRQQLRSLLNNSSLIEQGFVYVIYSDDPQQNGWYQPDAGQFTDLTSPVGLATGLWQAQNPWWAAGKRRTHREAREVWMKDLRSGLFARDALGWVVSADFGWLPSLLLTVLPNGVSSPVVSVSQQGLSELTLPTGRDGGACSLVTGLSDATVVSFERAESALNLSDVIVYDRMGQTTGPTGGPGTLWQEVYGPDWPWNWLTAGQPNDAPVFDNGLVRVRYDASVGAPGFRVDVWTGSAYAEQGKMCFRRVGDTTGTLDTWLSASLVEWTPDRAVLQCVMSRAADTYSWERIYITVQRGELGVTFEYYPALTSAGAQADAQLVWTPSLVGGTADLNNSVVKIDSPASGSTTVASGSNGVNVNTFTGAGVLNVASTAGYASTGTLTARTSSGTAVIAYTGTSGGNQFTGCTLLGGGVSSGTLSTGYPVALYEPANWTPGAAGSAAYAATAGTGAGTGNSGQFSSGGATLGNINFFASENWAAILRCPSAYSTVGPYQTTISVVQAVPLLDYQGSSGVAYAVAQDAYLLVSQGDAGYLQAQVQFAATLPLQVMETEAMTLGSGSTIASDGAASGGQSVTGSRTTDANAHVTQAGWPGQSALYRVFARVKITSGTLNVYAKAGSTGVTVTSTSTSFTWVDLGEIANGSFELHAWGAGGTFSVDRIEAVLVQDRVRAAAIYSGSRDVGQAATQDSRTLGALVARL